MLQETLDGTRGVASPSHNGFISRPCRSECPQRGEYAHAAFIGRFFSTVRCTQSSGSDSSRGTRRAVLPLSPRIFLGMCTSFEMILRLVRLPGLMVCRRREYADQTDKASKVTNIVRFAANIERENSRVLSRSCSNGHLPIHPPSFCTA